MRSFMIKAALPLVLITALIASPSCIFDPKEEIDPPPIPVVEWPDMTNRDDVIKTILLAYEYPKEGESVSRYNGLLHSLFFFGLDPIDVGVGEPPILTRAEEIASTEWMFDVASELVLTIPETGTWNPYTEIEGGTCENCWESTRGYTIRFQIGDEEMTHVSSAGKASVIIIVAPDEADSSKWVLRAMYDVMNN